MNAPVSPFQLAEIKLLDIEGQIVVCLREQGPLEIERVQLDFKRQRIEDKLEHLKHLLLVARTELKRARAIEGGLVMPAVTSGVSTPSPEKGKPSPAASTLAVPGKVSLGTATLPPPPKGSGTRKRPSGGIALPWQVKFMDVVNEHKVVTAKFLFDAVWPIAATDQNRRKDSFLRQIREILDRLVEEKKLAKAGDGRSKTYTLEGPALVTVGRS